MALVDAVVSKPTGEDALHDIMASASGSESEDDGGEPVGRRSSLTVGSEVKAKAHRFSGRVGKIIHQHSEEEFEVEFHPGFFGIGAQRHRYSATELDLHGIDGEEEGGEEEEPVVHSPTSKEEPADAATLEKQLTASVHHDQTLGEGHAEEKSSGLAGHSVEEIKQSEPLPSAKPGDIELVEKGHLVGKPILIDDGFQLLAKHAHVHTDDPILYRIYEAPDGFKGTYEEVLAHEKTLEDSLSAATSRKHAHAANDPVLYWVYEAPDGFRGTYEEVLAHEQSLGLQGSSNDTPQEATNDPVMFKVYEAPDGFRSTSFEEVLEHEKKLDLTQAATSDKGGTEAKDNATDPVLFKVYEAPDGFRSTSFEEVVEHEKRLDLIAAAGETAEAKDDARDPVLYKVYEAPDGFRSTSYEEVLEHEEKLGLQAEVKSGEEGAAGRGREPILFRVYEAPDGFRGNYEEVLRHEQVLESGKAAEDSTDLKDEVIFRVYEAPDGFRGSYEEVLAHEQDLELQSTLPSGVSRAEHEDEKVLFKIYEAPDGFRGSYDEVLLHEHDLGLAEAGGDELDEALYFVLRQTHLLHFAQKLESRGVNSLEALAAPERMNMTFLGSLGLKKAQFLKLQKAVDSAPTM